MKAFLVDNVIGSIYISKCVMIITDKPEKICGFINDALHRGATVSECSGAYTGGHKHMILTVLSKGEAFRLKDYVHSMDTHAFVIINNSSDIMERASEQILIEKGGEVWNRYTGKQGLMT